MAVGLAQEAALLTPTAAAAASGLWQQPPRFHTLRRFMRGPPGGGLPRDSMGGTPGGGTEPQGGLPQGVTES